MSETIQPSWRQSLAAAITEPETLFRMLDLPPHPEAEVFASFKAFPLLVTHSFVRRMRRGDWNDPLLRQVLPTKNEVSSSSLAVKDAVGDSKAKRAPGLLQKYQSRSLLLASGACAIHCRYCFRRHYPYFQEPKKLKDFAPALQAIAEDPTIHEVILSGGDPLMLNDHQLQGLLNELAAISHLKFVRIHSRLPVVLPSRVTPELVSMLKSTRLRANFVIHSNHPNEVVDDCRESLQALVSAGIPTLNQSVLLRGINDDAETLALLSERLVEAGVMPYYLHLLDRVEGAEHFDVSEDRGAELIRQLRACLPGYWVPRLVREISGESSKTLIL